MRLLSQPFWLKTAGKARAFRQIKAPVPNAFLRMQSRTAWRVFSGPKTSEGEPRHLSYWFVCPDCPLANWPHFFFLSLLAGRAMIWPRYAQGFWRTLRTCHKIVQLQLARGQSRLIQQLLHPNTQVKAQGHVKSGFASEMAHRCL